MKSTLFWLLAGTKCQICPQYLPIEHETASTTPYCWQLQEETLTDGGKVYDILVS